MIRTAYPEKTYIGIDNGASGSVGAISLTGSTVNFFHTPTFSCLNYQKEKKNITRIDTENLQYKLRNIGRAIALIERPLVNPGMFAATLSAVRALEATLIVLERLKIPHQFVDSKEWQSVMLPNGVKGEALKKASLDIGIRLFPQFENVYKRDADGMLIAEWARRKML